MCFYVSFGTDPPDSKLIKPTVTVYPKKYAHGFVVLRFVVVMQSFIMNSHEVFIHIHQGCFAGTGAIVRLPQCQWSKPDGYGKISQCKTTTKYSKAKTVCIFLGIYCTCSVVQYWGPKCPFHWVLNTEPPRSLPGPNGGGDQPIAGKQSIMWLTSFMM